MIQKKACLLGAAAVGKTSLVARFVKGDFSEAYLATIGVKIDKRIVQVEQEQVNLILWDISAQEEFEKVKGLYLGGSSGYLLVADSTRPQTLDWIKENYDEVQQRLGNIPFVLVLNKVDLSTTKQFSDEQLEPYRRLGWTILRSSAKTGAGVAEAFQILAEKMLAPPGLQK